MITWDIKIVLVVLLTVCCLANAEKVHRVYAKTKVAPAVILNKEGSNLPWHKLPSDLRDEIKVEYKRVKLIEGKAADGVLRPNRPGRLDSGRNKWKSVLPPRDPPRVRYAEDDREGESEEADYDYVSGTDSRYRDTKSKGLKKYSRKRVEEDDYERDESDYIDDDDDEGDSDGDDDDEDDDDGYPRSGLHHRNINRHRGQDPSRYNFRYRVDSAKTGDFKRHEETRYGNGVRGSYSTLEADGSMREVRYVADDKKGFRAHVTRIPRQVMEQDEHEQAEADDIDESILKDYDIDIKDVYKSLLGHAAAAGAGELKPDLKGLFKTLKGEFKPSPTDDLKPHEWKPAVVGKHEILNPHHELIKPEITGEHNFKPDLHSFKPDLHNFKPEQLLLQPDLHSFKPEEHLVKTELHGFKPEEHLFKPDFHSFKPEEHLFKPDFHSFKPDEHLLTKPDFNSFKPEDLFKHDKDETHHAVSHQYIINHHDKHKKPIINSYHVKHEYKIHKH